VQGKGGTKVVLTYGGRSYQPLMRS
jgi:hypothetical protein